MVEDEETEDVADDAQASNDRDSHPLYPELQESVPAEGITAPGVTGVAHGLPRGGPALRWLQGLGGVGDQALPQQVAELQQLGGGTAQVKHNLLKKTRNPF